MKRLLIMTVGKTHSGKSSFAKELEKELAHSFVMDQDHHAEFLNTYYEKLLPKTGANTLKNGLSKYIIDYAIEQTNLHIIVCNANRSKSERTHLFEEFFTKEKFIRILVHFNLPDEILLARIKASKRNTKIFRGAYSNFQQVLMQQQNAPSEDLSTDEADYLFVIEDNAENSEVIQQIVQIAEKAFKEFVQPTIQ
ncbi:AAA family ATPase [Metasolibacillus meyeri]|uniref:AAA family ATPase n=1 Tax=Metasolibacillus meyeri TaxID=1071052 RepID=A0AAW9NKF1_9BACL|nr:AAA family ATPase [Metasolibacillus meyeri]MEC1176931.1 AAA family ATPase [Metasolibacillus meyeri]